MKRIKTTIIAFAVFATCLAALPVEANAQGPLRQWLRGVWARHQAKKAGCGCGLGGVGLANNVQQPSIGTQTAGFAQNPFNLQPGQCMRTCQQTCSRTVVNYVPYTAYRTVQKRVPVTQYRPVTNNDPCTGCTVTCMRPCTTYTYQCQRVPYTTYRPVYRQETYKVPVTTITNDCATGSCGTCPTAHNPVECGSCGTGGFTNQAPTLAPQQNFAPANLPAPAPTTQSYYEYPAGGAITTDGGFTPADQSPTLLQGVNPTSVQRPVLDRLNHGNSFQTSSQREVEFRSTPAMINIDDKTARSPVRNKWSYSPVRMASYTAPSTNRARLAPIPSSQSVQSHMKWNETGSAPKVQAPVKRNGWVEVN